MIYSLRYKTTSFTIHCSNLTLHYLFEILIHSLNLRNVIKPRINSINYQLCEIELVRTRREVKICYER